MLLDDTYSVDLHAHPALIPSLRSRTAAHHRRAIHAGGLGAVVFAAVGDLPLLGWRPRRGICVIRRPRQGELLPALWHQLEDLEDLATHMRLRLVHNAADLAAAVARRQRSFFLAIEGADFLEGCIDRVQAAYDRGVRCLQLVHYRINELGDIQTSPPVHGGLTPFGRDVVRQMNALGMLVDLAHATFEVTKGAVEISDRPVIVSHTNIDDATATARFVSREHARLVAQHGGLIGAWPVSIPAAGFSAFIDHVSRLVDAVGIEHVGIGTDLDGTGPYGLFTDYAQWPSIPAALLARGFGPQDVRKIMGDNFRRVLAAVTA